MVNFRVKEEKKNMQMKETMYANNFEKSHQIQSALYEWWTSSFPEIRIHDAAFYFYPPSHIFPPPKPNT